MEHDTETTEGRCERSKGRSMRTSHLVLLAVAVVGGIALLVTGIRAADRDGGWRAVAAEGAFTLAHWRGGHHGGPRFGRVCSERRDGWVEDGLDFVESFATFTPEQQPAWAELKTAVRAGSAKVGEACTQIEPDPANAPARLERVELMLTTGLAIVREVRPAFDQFYAVLDEDQQRALDRMIDRRRGD